MPLHPPKYKVVNVSPTAPAPVLERRPRRKSRGYVSFLFPRVPAASSALARFFPALEAAGSVMKPRALSG